MKKVLFVVDDDKLGGVSNSLINALNFINYQNITIDLLVLHKENKVLDNLPKNIKLITIPNFNVIDSSIKSLIRERSLIKILKKLYFIFLMKTGLIKFKIKKCRTKYNLNDYNIEVAYKDGFSTIFMTYGDTRKKIQWLHSDYDKFNPYRNYSGIIKKCFSNINNFVAVSKNVSKNFNTLYHQDEKTIIIYNIIDRNSLLLKSNEYKVDFPCDKLNIVTIGRFHPLKGNYRLIKIIKRLVDNCDNKNFNFTMIGDGEEFLMAKEYIKENYLESYINLLGKKYNPYPYLKNADLYVLPSYSESFGITLVESFLLNIPVLTTKVTSVDYLVNSKHGMIVENTDNDIYNGLITLINNKSKISQYKNNLSDYHYDIESEINKINKLLSDN